MIAEADRVINHKEKDPTERRIIVFIGLEGSGKSTISPMLSRDIKIPYFSTGDIIRNTAKNDPGPLGEATREMIRNDEYLSADLISKIVATKLSHPDFANGAIIDGALRTLEETKFFDETLKTAGKEGFEVDVFYLEIDPETGIQRILNSKNRKRGETRETIQKHQSLFLTDLEDRLIIIEQRYNLYRIDGIPSRGKVYRQVIDRLNEK